MASLPRIPKTCVDCGSEYDTSVNQASRSKRCPECQAEAHRLGNRRTEARRYEAQKQARDRTDAAHWHPMYQDAWPKSSVLTLSEVKSGLLFGSFEPGTLFKDVRNKKIFRIANGKLAFAFMEE